MGDEKTPPAAAVTAVCKFKCTRYIASGVALAVVCLVVLIMYIVFRPSKPIFTLQDITVLHFNVTTALPYLLSTNMQVTISSRNAMSREAIIYDKIDLYVTYRKEQITLRYSLPSTYQEHKGVAMWSPYLEGHIATISPISGPLLMQDLNFGAVMVEVKIDGRMRFRAGQWTLPRKSKLYGNCPAIIQLGDMKVTGEPFAVTAEAFKFSPVENCHVEMTS